MSNTRIRLDSNVLHIRQEGDNDYEVWLNTESQDFDGLCIGCGSTEDAAMKDAEVVLLDAAFALQKRRKQ